MNTIIDISPHESFYVNLITVNFYDILNTLSWYLLEQMFGVSADDLEGYNDVKIY